MTRPQHWVVLNPDGSVACQPLIAGGASPSESGDNPEGLREFKVSRHGDLIHEHFDEAKRRWVSDRGRKRGAERRARMNGLSRDALADEIAAEISAQFDSRIAVLEARIAELEKKAK